MTRWFAVLAFFTLCGVARAQAVAVVAAGGSENLTSSATNVGLSIDGAVGWRLSYYRVVWGPELGVTYDRWSTIDIYFPEKTAFTIAPGIRVGGRIGDWVPSFGFRVGVAFVGLDCGSDCRMSSHGIGIQLDPAVDWTLSQHFGLRLHFGAHLALGDGSATWISFGPAIMVFQ